MAIRHTQGPVDDERKFKGRDKELARIREALVNESVSLIGPPKIGKSSILLHLPKYPQDHIWPTVSLETIASATSWEGFFQRFIEAVLERLRDVDHPLPPELQDTGTTGSRFPSERFPDPYSVFDSLCQAGLPNKLLIVCVDDFHCVQGRAYEDSVLVTLRELITRLSQLRFVLAAELWPYGEHWQEDTPMSEGTLSIRIDPLDGGRAAELVRLAESIGVRYPLDMIDEIIDLTGRHPYLLQVLCEQIEEDLASHDTLDVRESHVLDAADRVMTEYDETYFLRYWNTLSLVEQSLALVVIKSKPRKPAVSRCSVERIRQEVGRRLGLACDPAIGLSLLVRRCFLAEYPDSSYDLSSRLVEVWIADAKLEDLLAATIVRFPFGGALDRSLIQCVFPVETPAAPAIVSLRDQRPSPREGNPVILHISDIHFGRSEALANIPQSHYDSMSQLLKRDIEEGYERDGISPPNVIVISGDLAHWAMSDEYEKAIKFIDALCKVVKGARNRAYPPFDERRLIVVPGNHDINWALSQGCLRQRRPPGEPTTWEPKPYLYPYRFATFRCFYEQLYGRLGWTYPVEADRAYTIRDLSGDLGLVIVGFNSCSREDHKHHVGHVHRQAIEDAEDELRRMIEAGSLKPELQKLKIAVWHHNVMEVQPGDDHLDNWREVSDRLHDLNYRLILHGHIHQTETGQLEITGSGPHFETPRWIGAGSLAARADERPGVTQYDRYPMTYNVVEIDLGTKSHRLRLHTRHIPPGLLDPEWRRLPFRHPPRDYFETYL